MLDIKFIIQNAADVSENTKARNSDADVQKTIDHYEVLKRSKQLLEDLQQQSNTIAKKFKGASMGKRKELKLTANSLKSEITDLKETVRVAEKDFEREYLKIPNMTASDVPEGLDEEGNVAIKFIGTPTIFDFCPLDHLELGQKLDILDFEAGARVAGSNFYFLRNEGVILEMALIRLALDLAMKNGYTPVTTPELARDEMIMASGFNPRGPESQIYSVEGSDLSLIGTSEITIGGSMSRTIFSREELPIKVAGVSHCFRTEAGSSGRRNKGLYRVHQFSKVELYQVVHPDESTHAHEEMLSIEEEFFKMLGLPYRVMLMCKGDLGAPAYRKYDIEAWMPFIGESGGYGEVTSVSNCTDFQARRLNTRVKDPETGNVQYVHTLNGTAVAVTRAMLALLENNQQHDGTVVLPKVLHQYTGFSEIKPK